MVSVIITAYNVEQYISEAVESVVNQSYKDLQIIIVNDASTDRTAEVAAKAAKGDTRVSIVENVKNKGAGMARAIGVANATGDYIMFLDADDYYTQDFIKHLVEEAERTGADITSGGVTIIHEDGRKEEKTYGTTPLEGDAKVTEYWGRNIVFMNNRLIRSSMFDKVSYCKRRYIEDTPTIIPLLWYANKVAFVEDAGYCYRMRSTSLTHTADKFKGIVFRTLCILDLMDFFEKNDPSMISKVKLPETLGFEFAQINEMELHADQIERYKEEWLEITRRVLNAVQITKINYNPKKK